MSPLPKCQPNVSRRSKTWRAACVTLRADAAVPGGQAPQGAGCMEHRREWTEAVQRGEIPEDANNDLFADLKPIRRSPI